MDLYNLFYSFNSNYVIYVIFIIVIIVFLWILLRELRNWYWKHNQMIYLMEEISKKQTTLNNSINKQNNSEINIEVSPTDNTCKNEEMIKEQIVIEKPKESIWTRKNF